MTPPLPKIGYSVAGGAAWIMLSSPSDRNALSPDLVDALDDAISAALDDPAIRCLVITGSEGAFCAGADLKRSGRPSRVSFSHVLQRLWFSPKPVIAAVNGAAYAGGLGLVMAADIVIASQQARFAFSEVRIGAVPNVIEIFASVRLGMSHTTRLFLTGETFEAGEAERIGLAHRAVSHDGLKAAVDEQVEAIRRGAPGAIAAAKALTRIFTPEQLRQRLDAAQARSVETFRSGEAAEGMAAFRERRSPEWAGKP
ncbi:MAG: enoyl-CoA hydratase-related protein [Sphingobium sp.]